MEINNKTALAIGAPAEVGNRLCSDSAIRKSRSNSTNTLPDLRFSDWHKHLRSAMPGGLIIKRSWKTAIYL